MTAADAAPVFEGYARFYDRLYADKDYAAESAWLERVLGAAGVRAGADILDLGCGTAGHIIPLQQAGFALTGVDRSARMLEIAREKVAEARATAKLIEGDVRSVELDRTFDAVISMFAVVGYQLTNDDLASTFAVARRHLEAGGVFVFDAWFGPAVLSSRPEERSKRIVLSDGTTVVRHATPTLDVVAQTVRVDYDITREGAAAAETEVAESHTMRFLFAQEVAYFLKAAGFEVVSLTPFLGDGRPPTEHDWNVTWVARAVAGDGASR